MNRSHFMSYVKLLAAPVLLVLLGVLLLASPDSAATRVVRILGWILIVMAVGIGAWTLTVPGSTVPGVLGAVICGVGGIWMVTHPLGLAAWVGRLAGIVLVIQGLQDVLYFRSRQGSLLLPVLTAVMGVVLVVLPMTTSRLVFRGIGLVLLIIGGIMLYDRLRKKKQLREPDDPNIIDAL